MPASAESMKARPADQARVIECHSSSRPISTGGRIRLVGTPAGSLCGGAALVAIVVRRSRVAWLSGAAVWSFSRASKRSKASIAPARSPRR